MSLKALIDLKERLEYAAIAGTGLMQEDFRLRRAVEAMAPLAGINPVFARIAGAARALLNAPAEERNKCLLDVLSLVDAVVYTQGVSNFPGELIPAEPGAGTCVQIPYSQLQPLLAALGGAGGGRTAVIRHCWEEHPEYFGDFRVLSHAVKALGDNYGELAELIESILLKQGERIIPLLKTDFDPEGKTEMVRRLRLILWIGGEAENDWFVSILPECRKEVRQTVIQILGLCQGNTSLLVDLCRSEKGKLRDAALRSLAMIEDPEAEEFWKMEVSRHPGSVAVLGGVNTRLAADLSTLGVRNCLEKLLERGKPCAAAELEQLQKLTAAFCGKYSDTVREFWLWIAQRMEQLHSVVLETSVMGCDCSLAELMQRCLLLSILRNPCYGMLHMARELSSHCRRWFLCCGLMADLVDLDCPPKETYERYALCIVRQGLLKRESEQQAQERIQIMRVFSSLVYDPESGLFAMAYSAIDPLGDERISVLRLRWLDSRWPILLADHGVCQEGEVYDLKRFWAARKVQTRMEYILMNMISPAWEDACRVCGEYLYQRVKTTGQLQLYLDALRRCGWKNWQGLLAHCVRKQNQVMYHRVLSDLDALPISNREKAAELRLVHELAVSGAVSVWNRTWPGDQVEHLIARLESDETAQIS